MLQDGKLAHNGNQCGGGSYGLGLAFSFCASNEGNCPSICIEGLKIQLALAQDLTIGNTLYAKRGALASGVVTAVDKTYFVSPTEAALEFTSETNSRGTGIPGARPSGLPGTSWVAEEEFCAAASIGGADPDGLESFRERER